MKALLKRLINSNSKAYQLISFLYNYNIRHWQPRRFNNLEILIAAYAGHKSSVAFIQVGSNDGISNDPIHKFIQKFNWRGICIEPIPDNFENLSITYRDNKNVISVNAAIGNDGTQTIYFINPVKAKALGIPLPSWHSQLASFNKELVVSDIRGADKLEIVDDIQIRSLAFVTLLKEYEIANVDLLHIDTEGADWMILSSFPFDRELPDVILFEHNHLNLADYKTAVIFLQAKGYRLLRINTDTICYHKKVYKILNPFFDQASLIFN